MYDGEGGYKVKSMGEVCFLFFVLVSSRYGLTPGDVQLLPDSFSPADLPKIE